MGTRRSWLLVLALILIAAACGRDGDTTQALATSLPCDEEPSPEEVASYEVPQANERYRITLMQVSLAGYYYQGISHGAHVAAEEAGVELTELAAEGYASPEVQLQQIEDALQRGTDALVMAPSDIQGSVPVVEAAREAGIPVVNISTEVDSDEVYMVMQDDYLLGQLAADRVAEVVGEEGGPGIVIAGPANATWSRKRTEGFTDRVREAHPQLEIAAAPTQLVDPAEGLKSFEDAVQAHPDIKWIMSVHYFILQPGSLPPQYKGTVPYVSFGYEPDSIQGLEEGTLDSVFGIEPVAMGKVGVGTAIELLNGGSPPRVNCIPAPVFTAEDIGTMVANAELIEGQG